MISSDPTEADSDNEGNINHSVIGLVLDNFIPTSKQLLGGKEIVSTDGQMGGTERFFVIVDLVTKSLSS